MALECKSPLWVALSEAQGPLLGIQASRGPVLLQWGVRLAAPPTTLIMSKGKTRHTRKTRRATQAVLKFGPSARPTHKSRSGRTGQVRSSQLKGRSLSR